MTMIRAVITAAVWALVAAAPAYAAPVLLISIDGMRADDLTHAKEHGLDIPTLTSRAASGAAAEGVRGVLPTITYPSHTTMITGVHPSKHGITGNATFDPEGRNMGGWMWYASDLRVPTLWDTVKAKGGPSPSRPLPRPSAARPGPRRPARVRQRRRARR